MIKDFKEWVSWLEPGPGEIRQMIDAVQQGIRSGIINCVPGNGPDIWIISEDGQSEQLLLVSRAQRQAFLDFLDDELFRGESGE